MQWRCKTLTLNESLTGGNDGTITFNAASKTLTEERFNYKSRFKK